ncbi:xanthine dehydrogenase family protein molybdopterin-binding subunit [Amaricoccus solimangrovi]|uniref:Xanthine dehydrogenase family protein molybdopterin-binding subunit n=1 Tax=Amaricoccus solimangrovi TaxID=2589815 RepID=A0A501WNX9_9RHOB|nr:molybdopterin cofactor-binding domain-containing protein [Amaricoccus solimangrovi]TPE51038.1 xanthine dehydrogenase family protein molybdopterin-binding subunit [Amaricoccus solimangrovi]
MGDLSNRTLTRPELSGGPVNLSRRGFLLASSGAAAGSLVLGLGLPGSRARAQEAMAPGTRVPAFLEIRPDGTVRLLSPFVEGGQGVFTAMAQIVGEELDADPATFVVENAPPGADYQVMEGMPGFRITGGSLSVRTSYAAMRRLGALARAMLMTAAAAQLGAPVSELSTEPGRVVHAASGRSLGYGELAPAALDLPVPDPESVTLRDPAEFRWIRQPVKRLDVYEKSTGKAVFAIDAQVEGMLHAAVQHAPRLGMTIGTIRNEDELRAMKGVHSVHHLPGAVAVVAERWWDAKRAAEAAQVDWREPEGAPEPNLRHMPADFSTDAFGDALERAPGDGEEAEAKGDAPKVLGEAETVVGATYRAPFVNHAQLEPPATLARFNPDGTLDLWVPNQAPDMFQADAAKQAGIEPARVRVHSPLLGGFFGRHFLYPSSNPYPQAIALAKAVGRPVKVIWSREEEFLRDRLRPMAVTRFRGTLDADGLPLALEAVSACEGPSEAISGRDKDGKLDPMATEGLTGKAYAIPNVRVAQIYVQNPTMLGYWRSVGHSMNDFLYESFFDEMADQGGQDPYELRLRLLAGNERLTNLLKAVGDLSGGWRRGPFTAEDGSRRARGVAMASPFGSEAASIAEVSIEEGEVRVHDLWQAIDPGSIVNPAIIEAQVNSAVALGLSQVLLEEARYEKGQPVARNFDMYPILPPDRMPRVHVRVVESGAPMGGIGEPGLPSVPPAVANAVSHLTGQRARRMPLSRLSFES